MAQLWRAGSGAKGVKLEYWIDSRKNSDGAAPCRERFALNIPGRGILSRGDGREDLYRDDVDRPDFSKTLAETGPKTDGPRPAYGWRGNPFHGVRATPEANLVEGRRWRLSPYPLRLHHRHKLFGHVLSGRYTALIVDGSGRG